MKRILWISRHTMTDAQFSDLECIMGDRVELDQWTDTLTCVDELKHRLSMVDGVTCVLPMVMIGNLLPLLEGKPVMQAVSGRVATGEMCSGERQFLYVHRYWEQILKVEIEAVRCEQPQ